MPNTAGINENLGSCVLDTCIEPKTLGADSIYMPGELWFSESYATRCEILNLYYSGFWI